MKAFVFFALIGFTACDSNHKNQFTTQQASPVIYGEDNRKDFDEVSDTNLKEMAGSTVALIEKEKMTLDTVFNVYRFEKPSSTLPLCPSEKFHDQSTWAFCSGSLVAPDVVLTAGHCIEDEKDCKSTFFVFDYELHGKQKIFSQVSAENVFTCSEIIYSGAQKQAADFALIRLDREVKDREPLALSDKEVVYSDQLMMIGHPEGYPTKFTFGGKIRSLLSPSFFRIAIDAYSGNSGSSVFDQNTYKIVGVLSRGENDYVRKNSCLVSNVCDEETGCRGEDVTRIEEVKKYLPKDMQPVPQPKPLDPVPVPGPAIDLAPIFEGV